MRVVGQAISGLDVRRAVGEKHHAGSQLGQCKGIRHHCSLDRLTRQVLDDGLATVFTARAAYLMKIWVEQLFQSFRVASNPWMVKFDFKTLDQCKLHGYGS